jgi:hypothetical protein
MHFTAVVIIAAATFFSEQEREEGGTNGRVRFLWSGVLAVRLVCSFETYFVWYVLWTEMSHFDAEEASDART